MHHTQNPVNLGLTHRVRPSTVSGPQAAGGWADGVWPCGSDTGLPGL